MTTKQSLKKVPNRFREKSFRLIFVHKNYQFESIMDVSKLFPIRYSFPLNDLQQNYSMNGGKRTKKDEIRRFSVTRFLGENESSRRR